MENTGPDMSGYFRSLERALHCPKKVRRPFLDQTKRMAQDYIQGNPNATPQEVEDFLGDPKELAQGFLETLDSKMLERYKKRKKFFHFGCIAGLAVLLIIMVYWAIHLRNEPNLTEITSTIIIYPESTEGT